MLNHLDETVDLSDSSRERSRLARASSIREYSWAGIVAGLVAIFSTTNPECPDSRKCEGECPSLYSTLLFTGTLASIGCLFYARKETVSAARGLQAAVKNEEKKEEIIRSLKTLELTAKLLLSKNPVEEGFIESWKGQLLQLQNSLKALNITEQENKTLTAAFEEAFAELTLSPSNEADSDEEVSRFRRNALSEVDDQHPPTPVQEDDRIGELSPHSVQSHSLAREQEQQPESPPPSTVESFDGDQHSGHHRMHSVNRVEIPNIASRKDSESDEEGSRIASLFDEQI